MPDTDKVLFGEVNFRNRRARFGIKTDDRRRHMYVIGKTGMGKTEILKNMVIQDIQAGRGLAFLDPHGDTAEDLPNFIPKERIDDVVFFDPSDLAFPVAFNVMENVDDQMRHLLASGLLGVFKKIFPDVWSARMEYILNNTILALLEYPGSTLLGINRLLADKAYRELVIQNVTDPIVKAFWTQEFAKYTDRLAVEATSSVQNKIGQFTSSTLIRNIVGQVKSSLDMRKIMDEKKILIMNLARGKIGEDASRLLGALFITKIQLAAMSRADIPEDQRTDFYLYVDEFQHFATDSFTNILSEARKFKLNLIIAHQYIAQLDERVRDAVFGNIGTLIAFRVGAEDAEVLEKELAPEFTANDLVNLSKWQIYLKLMIDGVASNAFSANTLPPFPKLETSYQDQIIEASRKKYAHPKEEVEKHIAQWAQAMMESFTKREFRTSQGRPFDQAQSKPFDPLRRSFSEASRDQGRFGGGQDRFQTFKRPAQPPLTQRPSVVSPQPNPAPAPVSLQDALKKGAVDFRGRKIEKIGPGRAGKKADVDLKDLKQTLEGILSKDEDEKS